MLLSVIHHTRTIEAALGIYPKFCYGISFYGVQHRAPRGGRLQLCRDLGTDRAPRWTTRGGMYRSTKSPSVGRSIAMVVGRRTATAIATTSAVGTVVFVCSVKAKIDRWVVRLVKNQSVSSEYLDSQLQKIVQGFAISETKLW